jgi:hypothetical protein
MKRKSQMAKKPTQSSSKSKTTQNLCDELHEYLSKMSDSEFNKLLREGEREYQEYLDENWK